MRSIGLILIAVVCGACSTARTPTTFKCGLTKDQTVSVVRSVFTRNGYVIYPRSGDDSAHLSADLTGMVDGVRVVRRWTIDVLDTVTLLRVSSYETRPSGTTAYDFDESNMPRDDRVWFDAILSDLRGACAWQFMKP